MQKSFEPKRIALTPSREPSRRPSLPVLGNRLGAAADFLRGGVMADVGTDHAYLPLWALLTGKCPFAVATDIHEAPARIAAANLSDAGIGDDRAAVLYTDGLHGAEQYEPRDVCVLGMGGETIVHVLSEAPFLRDPALRLILQPMTHPEALRTWLGKEGFTVTDEVLTEEEKIYQILCAAYTGEKTAYTPLEAMVGKKNLQARTPLLHRLLGQIEANCRTAMAGKQKGGGDASAEAALLSELCAFSR